MDGVRLWFWRCAWWSVALGAVGIAQHCLHDGTARAVVVGVALVTLAACTRQRERAAVRRYDAKLFSPDADAAPGPDRRHSTPAAD